MKDFTKLQNLKLSWKRKKTLQRCFSLFICARYKQKRNFPSGRPECSFSVGKFFNAIWRNYKTSPPPDPVQLPFSPSRRHSIRAHHRALRPPLPLKTCLPLEHPYGVSLRARSLVNCYWSKRCEAETSFIGSARMKHVSLHRASVNDRLRWTLECTRGYQSFPRKRSSASLRSFNDTLRST